MKRRSLLIAAASVVGASVATLGVAQAATSLAATTAPAAPAATTADDPDAAVEPAYGAGLFDVDPDQGDVSQDPSVAVSGDVSALSEDWGF